MGMVDNQDGNPSSTPAPSLAGPPPAPPTGQSPLRSRRPWYASNWFLLLLIVFVAPIGTAVMWCTRPRWNIIVRMLVTVWGLIIISAWLIPTKSSAPTQTTPPAFTAVTASQPPTAATTAVPVATAAPSVAPTMALSAAPTSTIRQFTNENWGLALSDGARFKDSPVVLFGRIFNAPEISPESVAFQMFTNKDATDGNTIVVASPDIKVKKDDYVKVTGRLFDMFDGKNAFGGQIRVPRIRASAVALVTREAVVAPAIKKYEPNQPVSQNGLVITIQRVELAELETRVYVTVTNQSTEKASVYSHSAKLVQGTRQLEPKISFRSEYPALPSDILPGVEAQAVLVFDAVRPTEAVRVVWDGPRLANYRLTFKAYEWSVGP